MRRKSLLVSAMLLAGYLTAFVVLRLAFNSGASFTHVRKAGTPRLIVKVGFCFYPLAALERGAFGTSGGLYRMHPDVPPFDKPGVGP